MNMAEFLKTDSAFLTKDDVPGQGVLATILGTKIENVGDDTKPIIGFTGGFLKPMVLNKTNTAILIGLFGEESNGWAGKTIHIYNDPSVSYGGKVTGGLRIKAALSQQPVYNVQPAAPVEATAALSPAQQYEIDQRATAKSLAIANDDIPF